MPDIQEARRGRLREKLASAEIDAALVTKLVNVRYLTGFTGSNGAVLVTADGAVLATDGRYDIQSAAQAPDIERVITRGLLTGLIERAQQATVRRLAFESHVVTVDEHRHLVDKADGVELVSLRQAVEALRTVKDADEVAAIRAACAAADAAFTDLLATLAPGRTERDIAIELEARMRAHGSDGPSFESIVAGGPHSAIPHHRPTDRPVQAGEFLKLDFGALKSGYHSDMTRTLVIGRAADWQRELYDLVAAAQRAGRDAVAPGIPTKSVDEAARSVIERAELGERFVHGLGHGVGLEIHEAPALGKEAGDVLARDMVITIEPGVYLPDRGGVRIEDTLVVGEGGVAEILTTTTRELVEVSD